MRRGVGGGWVVQRADNTDVTDFSGTPQLERIVGLFDPAHRRDLIVDGRETLADIFFEQLNNIYADRVGYMNALMQSYANKLNGELRVALNRVKAPFVENALVANLEEWREIYTSAGHVETEQDHNIVLYETVYNRLQYLLDLIAATQVTLSAASGREAWLTALYAEVVKLKDEFVGLENIKESIGTRIALFLMYPRTFIGPRHLNFMLQGAPGTGKSTVALVIMQIYYRLGFIFEEPPEALASLDKSDFVAQYQGQSTYRTRELIATRLGSGIFLDEAYALIAGKDDQYGHDALNQIVLSLSDYVGLIVFVMAGYQAAIEERLFASNSGLPRRFSDIYVIRNYKPDVLFGLLENKLAPFQFKPDERTEMSQLFELIYEEGGFAKTNASAVSTIKSFADRIAFSEVLREYGVTRRAVALQYSDVLTAVRRYAYIYGIYLIAPPSQKQREKEERVFLDGQDAPPPLPSRVPPPAPAPAPVPAAAPPAQGRGARTRKPSAKARS